MNGWLLALIALIYIGILFSVAWYGDHQGESLRKRWRPLIYSLSLTVYCTSWTFFGAVGQAHSNLWSFIPIYLGPILVFVVFWKLMVKMILVSKQENITSIADFIASRHGRSRMLAILVTLILVAGILPYIALQLKAIVMGFDHLADTGWGEERWSRQDLALVTTIMLAVFVIIFGTRRLDTTEHQHGVMTAIAFESLIKLGLFLAVGGWVTWKVFDQGLLDFSSVDFSQHPTDDWLNLLVMPTIMAMTAILCLPRQFHVIVVENASISDFHRARWLFPAYLLLAALFVMPLALAGQAILGNEVSSDAYVIALPKALGSNTMAVLAYLGGVSAAISMVIVATIALSTMISNEILMPLILSRTQREGQYFHRFSGLLLNVRRTTILCLLLMAYFVYRVIDQAGTLAGIGQMSFSAVSQLAPALIGGLYFTESNKKAAIAGILVGIVLWFHSLVIPTLVNAYWMDSAVMTQGPFGIEWLKPDNLFGLGITHTISGASLLALALNVICYLMGCLYFRPDFEEKRQARKFVQASIEDDDDYKNINVSIGELEQMARQFVGEKRVLAMMSHFRTDSRTHLSSAAVTTVTKDAFFRYKKASNEMVIATERMLAGTMGASSARIVMKSLLAGASVNFDDVQAMVTEASEAFHFNREMLQGSIEHISLGISVVDRDLRLVAWNRRYLELFNYPDGLIVVGRSIADIIRHNARQGLCGAGTVDEHIRKRMSYMQQGTAHKSERIRPDGQVILMQGNPMPGGGFVMSFTDITEFRQVEQKLTEVNESLELRVQERTKELSVLNLQLLRAKSQAERANKLRSRFFAAVSHDLMQPMNAARLFASSLELAAFEQRNESQDESESDIEVLVRSVSSSLKSAEELLTDLLDMSRLEAGKLQSSVRDFPLAEIFAPLKVEFSLLASEQGIEFRLPDHPGWVTSDPVLLRRILQNFLTNAYRYGRNIEQQNRVLLAVRRSAKGLRIEVRDNGPGIPAEKQELIFAEFQRLEQDSKGLGLGLAIAKGIASMLGHKILLSSDIGKGTVFSVTVPMAERRVVNRQPSLIQAGQSMKGVRVLCVDNEPDILNGMEHLLRRWDCEVHCARSSQQTFAVLEQIAVPNILLIDYRLEEAINGIELIGEIRKKFGNEIAAILITADKHDELRMQCRELNVGFLGKPLKPAGLRALMNHLSVGRAAGKK